MALKIAFIGYNERLTRMRFAEFAVINREQILFYAPSSGEIILRDGTRIKRISSGGQYDGYRFDQVIVADDGRLMMNFARQNELAMLSDKLALSTVPQEFQWLHYNLDAEV